MNAPPVIELDNVTFAYRGMTILEDICLTVGEGDFLGIVGPNGGGKTTLLRLILGLLAPGQGSVRLFGDIPSRTRHLVGYVPQYSVTDPTFPITSVEVVAMGALEGRSWGWRLQSKTREAAFEALGTVGIEHLAHVPYGELSGGQRQRCLIARALAAHPRMLILDEATASIDSTTEEHFYDLLRELNTTMTILLVSHDIGVIASNVSHVACINRRLACHRSSELDTADIVTSAYTGDVTILTHHCKL